MREENLIQPKSHDTIRATGEARATASSEAVARTTGAVTHSHSGAHPYQEYSLTQTNYPFVASGIHKHTLSRKTEDHGS